MLLVSHTGLSHAHAATSQEGILMTICQTSRGLRCLCVCGVLGAFHAAHTL